MSCITLACSKASMYSLRRSRGTTEKFAVPRAMVSSGDEPRILLAQNLFDALLDPLKTLPVTARRKRIPMVAVGLGAVWIPVARADALDQFRSDAVAFYR